MAENIFFDKITSIFVNFNTLFRSGMQEERQLSWSLQTRELATSLSGTRDLLDGLSCESVHLMTILNIAKILMNMKSSWFSDL